ncbi:hypothetical protein BAE44_0006004 [Dichanthelium oligosanthes]|uniref:Zinc beta-ribbon domain-containing protein n=1 Tax=Dichanthelium oligosanthes TaxID=888268 RepID=A0A1E5W6V6_9POAL|nr:hypothetical protein BAE44_0006004 [Dichanthelium oligosanthes]
MDPSGAGAGASRRKAEQWLSVAEKLLVARDLEGCKQFATQALAADPHTPGADDLYAAATALLAAQRHRRPNGQPDPYVVLGLDPANPVSRRPDAIHSQYRRLSFLLNRSRPDRPCSLALAEAARLVADAWAFLSNPVLKSALDAELDAAAAARAYHSPAPNLPQPHSQSPLPARPTPPAAAPSPRPTPPPAIPSPRPTPPLAAPSPRPVSPPPRRTPPPVASLPRPTQRPVASQTRPPPLRAAPASAPRPTPPPPVAPQTQPSPPLPSAPQTPIAATVPAVQTGAAPSSTFWTVCSACCHIHQYDRQYETIKLLCPSCRQPFVAEAMADPPPIVPGTDMYYCTWGFFPVGFPGCPGFERMVNSQPQGPDQLNAPWLGGTGGVKDNTQDNAQNGVPPVSVPVVEVPVEAPAVTPPAKPMRVKVGAKKRGRPKGSKNKKKL